MHFALQIHLRSNLLQQLSVWFSGRFFQNHTQQEKIRVGIFMTGPRLELERLIFNDCQQLIERPLFLWVSEKCAGMAGFLRGFRIN